MEYGEFWSLTEVFEIYNSGIKTSDDKKLFHFEDDFNKEIQDYESKFVKDISSRTFDNRKIYFDAKLIDRPRLETMQHMIKGENVGLIFMRGFTGADYFN